MQKDSKAIVLTDSKYCRIYKAIGLNIVKLLDSIEYNSVVSAHKRQDLRTGFYQKSSTPSHFFDPPSDSESLDREAFCKEVIRILVLLDNKHKFTSIILIADPRFLGVIRQHLSKTISSKVIKEINKDLTHLSLKSLEARVLRSN